MRGADVDAAGPWRRRPLAAAAAVAAVAAFVAAAVAVARVAAAALAAAEASKEAAAVAAAAVTARGGCRGDSACSGRGCVGGSGQSGTQLITCQKISNPMANTFYSILFSVF